MADGPAVERTYAVKSLIFRDVPPGAVRQLEEATAQCTLGGYRPYRCRLLGKWIYFFYTPRERRYAPVMFTLYGRQCVRQGKTEVRFFLCRGLLDPLAIAVLYFGSMLCLCAFLRVLPWQWWVLAPLPFVVIPVLYTYLGTRLLPGGRQREQDVLALLEQIFGMPPSSNE